MEEYLSEPIDTIQNPEDWDLDELKRGWEHDGCAIVRNFASPKAVAQMIVETEAQLPNVFFQNTMIRAGYVSRDMIGPQTLIARIHNDKRLMRALSYITGKRVYQMADPLAGLVVGVTAKSGVIDWHYDPNDVTLSVSLTQADRGGEFEYINPTTEEIVQLMLRPGDLQIFNGHSTSHRVCGVDGNTLRMTALFAYCWEPGLISQPASQMVQQYGRSTEMHRLVEEFGSVQMKASRPRE